MSILKTSFYATFIITILSFPHSYAYSNSVEETDKQSSNQAIKQSSNQAIKQSSNQAIKQSSNQAIKQSSNQAIKPLHKYR